MTNYTAAAHPGLVKFGDSLQFSSLSSCLSQFLSQCRHNVCHNVCHNVSLPITHTAYSYYCGTITTKCKRHHVTKNFRIGLWKKNRPRIMLLPSSVEVQADDDDDNNDDDNDDDDNDNRST